MTPLLQQTTRYWWAGGPLLVPIALVCLGIWGCFGRSRSLLARILREGRRVERALEDIDAPVGPVPLNMTLAALGGGMAALLRRVLDDVALGAQPEEAFAARAEACKEWLRRDFLLLATLTAVAPLLGLLGTVMGMVETFQAVAALSGNTGSRVAAGISRALITTQFGLVVALPGVFGLARLQRMFRHVEVLMETCRTQIMLALEAPPEIERS